MLWERRKGQKRWKSILNRKPGQQRRAVTEGSQEVALANNYSAGRRGCLGLPKLEEAPDRTAWTGAVLASSMATLLGPYGLCAPREVWANRVVGSGGSLLASLEPNQRSRSQAWYNRRSGLLAVPRGM